MRDRDEMMMRGDDNSIDLKYIPISWMRIGKVKPLQNIYLQAIQATK